MDRILTVQQPHASALLTGIKRNEYRPYRIPQGVKVWIHAGLVMGMQPLDVIGYVRDLGDANAADYLMYTSGQVAERPEPTSPMALHIYNNLGLKDRCVLPYGKIIGWCIFGEATRTTGDESKLGVFANPVTDFQMLPPEAWKVHKGSLGVTPFGGI